MPQHTTTQLVKIDWKSTHPEYSDTCLTKVLFQSGYQFFFFCLRPLSVSRKWFCCSAASFRTQRQIKEVRNGQRVGRYFGGKFNFPKIKKLKKVPLDAPNLYTNVLPFKTSSFYVLNGFYINCWPYFKSWGFKKH